MKPTDENKNDFLYVKTGGALRRISPDGIIYIEIVKRGVLLHIGQEIIFSHENLDTWENKLFGGPFYRIHKSILVNTDRIVSYSRTVITVENGITLPVAHRREEDFRKFFVEKYQNKII